MAEATRNQAALREQEEHLEHRITSKLEACIMEITSSIRKAIDSSIDRRILETLQKNFDSEINAMDRGPHHRDERHANSNYSCGTRLAQIDFPRFSGDAVQQWIYQCETYFAIDGTPAKFRVKLVVIHFEGKALQWHTSFVKTLPEGNLPKWTEFTNILIDRFGVVYDDPMAKLMQLRQKGTVVEYHDQFDAITSRLDISVANLLSCFLGGLKKDI